jgi:hypothetical protein
MDDFKLGEISITFFQTGSEEMLDKGLNHIGLQLDT